MRMIDGLRRMAAAALTPAEDPRATTGGPSNSWTRLLDHVHAALDQASASRSRLEYRIGRLESALRLLDHKAAAAQSAGHDSLARVLLSRGEAARRELVALQEHLQRLECDQAELLVAQARLEASVEALAARRHMTVARYDAAAAHVHVTEALAGISEQVVGLTDSLLRAERETDAMEARASALDELVAEVDRRLR